MLCKLSTLETICMKHQNLCSEKNKKNILIALSAENFTQSAEHLKQFCYVPSE